MEKEQQEEVSGGLILVAAGLQVFSFTCPDETFRSGVAVL